jgi:tricorn protease
MKKAYSFILLCYILVFIPANLSGINPKDTRMLAQPAISQDHIAFIYAEDLWLADIDGSYPRRLTIDEGVESNPFFSPDGSLIAFSAQYDGNNDVYILPVEGGIPVRLTWHPDADIVRGFTPDGKSVLFSSQRNSFTNRYSQLYTVPVTGGFPVLLEIPNVNYASYSSDGLFMAYTPIGDNFRQWKNYRGGGIATIWLFSFQDKSVVKIPQPIGGCNDTDPVWMDGKIYFLSDRNGEFNIFSYDNKSSEIRQLTEFKDFPVINMSAGHGKIIFEQAGYLHTYSVSTSVSQKLTIGIATDLQELRSRFVKGDNYIRSADISPTGSRVVFDFRGDILTVPAEKGDDRNLTSTPGVHEKFPTWSPDGKNIAYFSDASGEYELNIQSQDGKGEIKTIHINGTGFYAFPEWSPDSKKICFVDNGRNLYMLDVISGTTKKIDADDVYFPGPFRDQFGDWSADSKWFAYTKITATNFSVIHLYSVDQDKSFVLTDGLSNATEPVFDPGGRYLFFFASTDAGPVVNWFDQSNIDMRSTNSIYLVTLQKDTLSPFAKESDEEKAQLEVKPKSVSSKKISEEMKKEPPLLKIDLDGIQNRIINIPVKAGNYRFLGIGKEGELLYVVYPPDNDGQGSMRKFNMKDRKDTIVMELDGYILSAKGDKMLYVKGNTWGISDAGVSPQQGKGILKTADLQVKIEPLAEWENIFNEVWRINRDYFYDPGMHGADWPTIKAKYAQFLPDLTCRADLNTLIQWMSSELSVGHSYITNPGEKLNNPKTIPGGLLGADFIILDNRYQLKKIYGGLNWNPGLRSPLTEPGINAKVGDYILAINGKDLTAPDNIYKYFESTAGKITELTIGPNPNYLNSRIVKVVPIESERALRNRDWVEGNLQKVNKATSGQVAYVYVPNTADAGHEYFKRYFFPQVNKKAVIIDERFNGGGSVADYYIDILQRPLQAYWNTRYGKDVKTPSASIQGPKVMIINESAGSGGDLLPWMFRKFKVGTLVGKRTWGGLVGILGFPELMDGGRITAPNLAFWTSEGFKVENEGIAPDIEVEQWPAEVIKGNDPQLQKAIEIILKELEKNPQQEPIRPPYPIKVKSEKVINE